MATPVTTSDRADALIVTRPQPYPWRTWRQIRNKILSDSAVLAQRARAAGQTSRVLLDFGHERRRESFGIYRQLARRAPRLAHFAPMCGAAGAPLSIVTEDRPEGHLIRVVGEIDLGNVALVRSALEPAVQNSQSVILDLSGVTYLDSTTLHATVTSDRQLKSHGCRLVVVGPPFLFKLLQITGLERHLDVVPTMEQASKILGDGQL